jgi:Fur family ferric uptake transcriptional regulator
MHAHFRCTGCAGVFCLDEVTMPEVRLPAGFRLMESRLELMGLCSSCS